MKVKDIKEKVAAKVAKGKEKVAKKCGKAAKQSACLFLIGLCMMGCQNPAQRAQTADLKVTIWGGNVTFGSEFVSLAQSNETAGNDAGMTASPTNDIKPDIDVSVPVNKAGAAQSVGSVLGDAVASLVNGSSKSSAAAATSTNSTDCTDSSCSTGACSDGSCSPQ